MKPKTAEQIADHQTHHSRHISRQPSRIAKIGSLARSIRSRSSSHSRRKPPLTTTLTTAHATQAWFARAFPRTQAMPRTALSLLFFRSLHAYASSTLARQPFAKPARQHPPLAATRSLFFFLEDKVCSPLHHSVVPRVPSRQTSSSSLGRLDSELLRTARGAARGRGTARGHLPSLAEHRHCLLHLGAERA